MRRALSNPRDRVLDTGCRVSGRVPASSCQLCTSVAPFQPGLWEILSVYYKPAPACNYAQTACQAALAAGAGIRSGDIVEIRVACSAAAVAYPGCNYAGPFDRILQCLGVLLLESCVTELICLKCGNSADE